MAVPENYKKLGTVGTAYKGDYNPDTEYKKHNSVYYEGSTYIALIDNPVGEPKDDGINWKYQARGASGIGAVTSVNKKTGDVTLTAADVSAIPANDKGKPAGVASLDEDGKVLKEQLPDDIGVDSAVVSDKFSTDKDYAAGEYCIYEDVLYKFTSPKEPGEWDEAVVEATNVVTELASLNSNLIDNETGITFQFGIDGNGNYGYIKAGADTVTPFSTGDLNKESLLKALQYSGLGLTESSTPEEIYAALAAYWPVKLYLFKSGGGNPFNLKKVTDYGKEYASVTVSESSIIVRQNVGAYSGYNFEFDAIDLTSYSKLHMEYSITGVSTNPNATNDVASIAVPTGPGVRLDGASRKNLELDISNVNAKVNITINTRAYSAPIIVTIYEMWLEV